MGCGASVEVDSNGRPKCSGTVNRRLLVFVRRPNRTWLGKPAPGSHYALQHEIDFAGKDLQGYRVVKPLECNLELAGAVAQKMRGPHYENWTFVCELRDGSRRLLPSSTESAWEQTDESQRQVVLMQRVMFCRCKIPDNHDITQTAGEEVRGMDGNVEDDLIQGFEGAEVMPDPPKYQMKA